MNRPFFYTSSHSILGISLTILFILIALPGFTQVITIGENELEIVDGQMSADNFLSEDRTLFFTPSEGKSIASVCLKNASETRYFYGRKITVVPKTTDFHLEGDGKIAWNNNIFLGPKEIIFDSTTSILTLTGTKDNPAVIQYPEFSFNGKANWFKIIGKMVNGNWQAKDLKSGDAKGTTIGTSSNKAKPAKGSSAPGPKLTNPKK